MIFFSVLSASFRGGGVLGHLDTIASSNAVRIVYATASRLGRGGLTGGDGGGRQTREPSSQGAVRPIDRHGRAGWLGQLIEKTGARDIFCLKRVCRSSFAGTQKSLQKAAIN